jgi:hypothetical protein
VTLSAPTAPIETHNEGLDELIARLQFVKEVTEHPAQIG